MIWTNSVESRNRRGEAGLSSVKSVGTPGEGSPGRVVTMRDIAKAAGVSQSTVSRVLSGTSSAVSIGAEARDRVLAVADRLGYRPNPLARGLRGASTMLLGVIVREIMDPFFAAAVEAITNESRARGYNLVLGQAHGRADEAIALRSVLETRHVDAMLILGDMRDQPRLIDDLRASSVPAVALWQGTALPGIATVNVDNAAGIRAALDLLTELGHERIALIVGRPLGDIQARRAAYLDYMTERGVVRDSYLVTVANDPAGGVSAMEALLRLEEPPTAVLATTDVLAIGALHAAHLADLGVPQDVSVVGFDDIPLAAFTVPALTTVRMPIAEMAAIAVRIAIDEGGGIAPDAQPPVHVVGPTLVSRESVGPPRGE
jgi:DNA-binding LacI/PurR family transcriptional regulator